jgi:hypothetical protein
MSKKLVPFSKEKIDSPTVSNDEGQRSGFTDHVEITHCAKPKQPPGLVGGMEWTEQDTERNWIKQVPDLKRSDDDGLPEFPAAFSKKTISGGPAKPGTPA